jgi:outer membrane protein insertion porin family
MGQSAPVVSKISVEGNIVTKEYIIRREIQHPPGAQLDSTIVSEDRNRLDNLGIFSSVVWDTISQKNGSVELVYRVLESWRIWPAASPFYSEDKGWSLGGGLRILNFRGRDQSFTIGGAIGAIQVFGLLFSDPWIVGDHISLSMNLGKNLFVHPFLPYVQSTEAFEVNLGRWFGYRWKVQAGFELEHKQFIEESDTLSFTYIPPLLGSR